MARTSDFELDTKEREEDQVRPEGECALGVCFVAIGVIVIPVPPYCQVVVGCLAIIDNFRKRPSLLRRAKRGPFLMKDERNERAKRIEWVSLVVDVAVCSHIEGFIARVFSKARSLRSLTSSVGLWIGRPQDLRNGATKMLVTLPASSTWK